MKIATWRENLEVAFSFFGGITLRLGSGRQIKLTLNRANQ